MNNHDQLLSQYYTHFIMCLVLVVHLIESCISRDFIKMLTTKTHDNVWMTSYKLSLPNALCSKCFH